jgi:cytochrome c553
MWHHFWDAAEARKAVIAGDLEAVRAPMQRLATGDYGMEIPVDWMPWIEEMQAEARRGQGATSLREAAGAVAALGTSCAECHRATGGGGKFEGDTFGYQHLGRKGLEEKMARHLWSAEELWLGLSGPVHQAWARGAGALMNITIPKVVTHTGEPARPDEEPTGEGTLAGEHPTAPPATEHSETLGEGEVDLDVALEGMRALGRRADTAAIPKDKASVYGEILFRCGSCHAHLGIRLQHKTSPSTRQ